MKRAAVLGAILAVGTSVADAQAKNFANTPASRQLALVLREHLLGQILAGRVVDRMREILVLSIRSFATRHRDEQAGVASNDLEAANDEGVVQRDADERFELLVIAK